ncbi:MAG: O-antigen ligase family protein [Candidatus Eisenbacteria bacterium]
MIHPEEAEAHVAPPAVGPSAAGALELRRAAPGVALLLFALLSPWSIAGAQTAVVLLALALGVAWIHGRTLRVSAAESAHGQRRENLPWTLRFAASAGLAGLHGLAQHFLGRDWLRGGTLERLGGGYMAVGTLGHHLSYAGVLLPAFFVALALGARRRWCWIPVAALIGGGILFSYARTAWVRLAGGLFCLGLVRGRRTLFLSLGGLVAISAIVLLAEPAVLQRFGAMLRLGEDPRSRLWLTALHIGRDHPWMGAGLGSWDVLFPLYQLPGRYMSTARPHSDVLNILVETGVTGVIAWLRESRSSGGRAEACDGIGRSGIRSAIGPREAGAEGEDHAAAPLR